MSHVIKLYLMTNNHLKELKLTVVKAPEKNTKEPENNLSFRNKDTLA